MVYMVVRHGRERKFTEKVKTRMSRTLSLYSLRSAMTMMTSHTPESFNLPDWLTHGWRFCLSFRIPYRRSSIVHFWLALSIFLILIPFVCTGRHTGDSMHIYGIFARSLLLSDWEMGGLRIVVFLAVIVFAFKMGLEVVL